MYNAQVHRTTKLTPFTEVYDNATSLQVLRPRVLYELTTMLQDAGNQMEAGQQQQKFQHDRKALHTPQQLYTK